MDKWALEIISAGYSIYFTSLSPSNPSSPSFLKDPSLKLPLKQKIDSSPALGCCRTSSCATQRKGFYFKYFLILKKNNTWRPILVLRLLNSFVKIQKFKMVTLVAMIPSLDQEGWFSALSLQDVYFNIAIQSSQRRFLCFILGRNNLQHRVLPYGFPSAPRVFFKGSISGNGLPLQRRNPDVSIPRQVAAEGHSYSKAFMATQKAINLLLRLDLQLNTEKSLFTSMW